MEYLTIAIYPASNGHYCYDIYRNDLTGSADGLGHEDGGTCTGDLFDVIDLAASHCADLLRNNAPNY